MPYFSTYPVLKNTWDWTSVLFYWPICQRPNWYQAVLIIVSLYSSISHTIRCYSFLTFSCLFLSTYFSSSTLKIPLSFFKIFSRNVIQVLFSALSFINLLIKYLLSTSCESGIILSIGDTIQNKQNSLPSWSLDSFWGENRNPMSKINQYNGAC